MMLLFATEFDMMMLKDTEWTVKSFFVIVQWIVEVEFNPINVRKQPYYCHHLNDNLSSSSIVLTMK